ncbi:MAG: hypothetical protein ABIF19_12420 [Planctomycetota bacterium]
MIMGRTRAKYSKIASKKRHSKRMFRHSFADGNLRNVFNDRISSKDNAGIDGIHPHDWREGESVEIINRKVSAGTYHFTPYAEIQSPKGRGKLPRIIALPSVRDQVVLSALKDYLHKMFPDDVNRKLPNSYIYELNEEIQNGLRKKLSVNSFILHRRFSRSLQRSYSDIVFQ